MFLKVTIMMKYIQRSGLLRLGFINQKYRDEISSITTLSHLIQHTTYDLNGDKLEFNNIHQWWKTAIFQYSSLESLNRDNQ